MADSPKLTSDRIVSAINRMREQLWPLWQRERALVLFYNGGALPTDCNDATDDDAPVSMGLGYRYIKKPLESLLDVMLTEPGFIQSDCCYPLKEDRKGLVQSAVDTEINQVVHDRMESALRSSGGRALITGRAFFFRLSKWDWRFRTGRLICSLQEGDDVSDESFREWAFTGQLTIRQLDSLIEASERYSDNGGWSNASLKALKRYIIETTCDEKDVSIRETYISGWMGRPLEELSNNPLDVYWYFRKSENRTDDGDEKIDLYCVSRWGMTSTIVSSPGPDNVTYKSLQQQGQTEKQQIIYKLEGAFDSVHECLIPMILDARIDGEQEMAQVDGVGRIMTPRLQSMEHLTTALLEGIAFGVQPNWTSKVAGAVQPEVLRALQRTGLSPWDYVPPGLEMMTKANSMQGMNQAMAMLQMLGISAEADAATGEMNPNGQSQAKFKAEALMMLQQLGTGLQRRVARAMMCYDELAKQIGETFTRLFTLWKKHDPAYYDVRRFQRAMVLNHRVLPAEFQPERLKFKCRRLSGGMDRERAVQVGTAFMQQWGGMISPSGQRFLGKEVARAQYDDSTANLFFPEKQAVNKPQQVAARDQNSAALVDLVVPPRDDEDMPAEHLPIHAMALQKRIQMAQQAGGWGVIDREGSSNLLMHMTLDARALPQAMQAQVGEMLQAAAKAIAQIPVNAGQDDALKMRAQMLKEAQFGHAQQLGQNLMQDRGAKQQLARDKFMLDVQRLMEDKSLNSVDKAKTLYEMMQPQQTAALPEQAESSPQAETA